MDRVENINGKIADIVKDIGLIFFASLFVGPIATGKIDPVLIVWGLVFSIAAWMFSLSITSKTVT